MASPSSADAIRNDTEVLPETVKSKEDAAEMAAAADATDEDVTEPADTETDTDTDTKPNAVPPRAVAAPNLPPANSTAVDGQGMWRSWTRVFAKPESACLDLLDNCFDAALKPGFAGRVAMTSHGETTISIQNNSQTPIKRLEDALTVYKSSKNSSQQDRVEHDSNKDSIGENGVGLKQGCAALSDCSMVFTKKFNMVEIGIIAKGLQSSQGVYLPSFSFNVQDPAADVLGIIEKWLSENPAIFKVLAQSLGGDGPSAVAVAQQQQVVLNQVTHWAERLWTNPWDDEDHVFLLVLCNLKKTTPKNVPLAHDLVNSVCPAKAFLHDMKTLLPEYYINLPSLHHGSGMFDFVMDQEPVDFSFWQRRLVELTKFEVHIPTDEPFETLPDAEWDQPAAAAAAAAAAALPGTTITTTSKYKLSIYCGFDARRVHDDLQFRNQGGTSTCMLYIYSCQPGRLIQKEVDARHMLGLSTSGVDYTQGLTVIINDVAGKLPLTPTKDAIAWSERTNGDVHQRNLLSWAGAVAQFYWSYHKNRFGGRGGNKVKENMKKTIRSFAVEDDQPVDHDDVATVMTAKNNMEDAQFTTFQGVKWKRIQTSFDNRWKIRKSIQEFTCLKGPDTLFAITSDRIQRIKEGRKLKQRNASASTPGRPRGAQTKIKVEWQDDPWSDIEPKDIPRVSMGVLSYLRDKDKERLFEVPVLEAMPQIKDQYLQIVKTPMDFRTIEKERIPSYVTIRELQQDLVLIFQNCIQFNGPASQYGKIAQQMLDGLNDALESTDVKKVAMSVLSYLRDMDERELFEIPVLEQVPEIKDAYLQVVSKPMDFRTIEEERIDSYTSIIELKDDLVLIFHNCIRFNGATSPYGVIAQKMLDGLDDAFEDITMGKRRRRKSRLDYDEIVNQYDNVGNEKATHRSVKKKIPYHTLARQLREAEKKLQKERETVKELRKQLCARDRRIRHLETNTPHLGDNTHENNSGGTKRSFDLGSSEMGSAKRRFDLASDEMDTWAPSLDNDSGWAPPQGDDSGCRICGMDNDFERLMLCEGCNGEYHIYCLTPPLSAVPVEDWYCDSCRQKDQGAGAAVQPDVAFSS